MYDKSQKGDDMDSFAERFKWLREKKKGWTQEQTAEVLGVSRSTIAGYESDQKGRIPRPETLNKIAENFGVSVDFLIRGEEQKQQINEDIFNATTPAEQEFIEWVRVNVDGTFFYDFDTAPEERKEQFMADMRYLWEREKKNKR